MSRKETAQKYIDTLNAEAKEIEVLEAIIKRKKHKIKSCLLYLRQAKHRNQVVQLDKYTFKVIE